MDKINDRIEILKEMIAEAKKREHGDVSLILLQEKLIKALEDKIVEGRKK